MLKYNVTALIMTYNCEQHLRRCLNSIAWASQILVCDSYSTDNTLAIVKEYTADIIQHEYINSASSKNWAIPQAKYEWIILVDSDEFLEPELQAEIQAILSTDLQKYDAYRIPRKNLIFGKWIKSARMYPDYQIRFFRRDVSRYETKEVHAHVLVDGQTGTLNHHIIHHDFEDVEATVKKWGRYIRYEGQMMRHANRRFAWYHILFRPPIVFFYFYFFTGGWREGFRGFYVAMMWAFYVFLKHARLWQLGWEETANGQQYWHSDNYDI